MCVCFYPHVYVHTYMYMYVYMQVHILCMYVCVCISVYVCIYMYTCMYVCLWMHVYVCRYICICIYICIFSVRFWFKVFDIICTSYAILGLFSQHIYFIKLEGCKLHIAMLKKKQFHIFFHFIFSVLRQKPSQILS